MAKRTRGGGRRAMSGLSTQALHKELERRQRDVAQLQRKAAQHRSALERVEVKIAALGGPEGGGRTGRRAGGRRKNKEGLAEALQSLLKGKKMASPPDRNGTLSIKVLQARK